MKKIHTFTGIDWTELYIVLEKKIIARNICRVSQADCITSYIALISNWEYMKFPEEEADEVEEICRAYLKKYIQVRELEGKTEDLPVWHGLASIEDQWNFLQLYSILFECMWN